MAEFVDFYVSMQMLCKCIANALQMLCILLSFPFLSFPLLYFTFWN